MNAADSGPATTHEQKPFEGESPFFCGMAPRAYKRREKGCFQAWAPGVSRHSFALGCKVAMGTGRPAAPASRPCRRHPGRNAGECREWRGSSIGSVSLGDFVVVA